MAILPYYYVRNNNQLDENGNFIVDKTANANDEVNDYYNNISLFMVKPICAILLHINMQPKVKEAIVRLIYLMQHHDKFDKDQTLMPIIICLMKLQMEFTLECMCIAIIAFSVNTDEAIMDFIALNVISELDESYFKAVQDPLKDKIK